MRTLSLTIFIVLIINLCNISFAQQTQKINLVVGDILGLTKDNLTLGIKGIIPDNKGNSYIDDKIRQKESFMMNDDIVIYVKNKKSTIENIEIGDTVVVVSTSKGPVKEIWKGPAVIDFGPPFGELKIK
jgi:hypothetical protein